jgi:hypothetical protein
MELQNKYNRYRSAPSNLIIESLTNQILPNQNPLSNADLLIENQNEDYVTASTHPKFFCVGIIDIVNSTKTVSKLSQTKASRYYELFLNTMAKSLNHFNT